MLLLLSILIPIITLIFLLIFFRKSLVILEMIILLVTPPSLICIFNLITTKTLTHDVEYWGGYVTSATYFEPWNEYIHKTCTRQVYSGNDSQGNPIYHTEVYDCSYVENHPPIHNIYGSNKEVLSISEARFNSLCNRFGNKTFRDMNRKYHSRDGDAYDTFWNPASTTTLETITTKHSWVNKVKASKSVFKFEPVDPKVYGLYSYPGIDSEYKQNAYLGPKIPGNEVAIKYLNNMNALLGASRKVRVFVLVFKNKPIEAALQQEAYWIGGKKNELNICIGLDDANKVTWSYVFSWTPKDIIKVNIKTFFKAGDPFDLGALLTFTEAEITTKWTKRNFKEFDYLSVEPPRWVTILGLIISILISILIAWISVVNEFHSDHNQKRRY